MNAIPLYHSVILTLLICHPRGGGDPAFNITEAIIIQ